MSRGGSRTLGWGTKGEFGLRGSSPHLRENCREYARALTGTRTKDNPSQHPSLSPSSLTGPHCRLQCCLPPQSKGTEVTQPRLLNQFPGGMAALGAGAVSGKTHPTTISLSQISQPHCLHCKGAPQRSFHHNS